MTDIAAQNYPVAMTLSPPGRRSSRFWAVPLLGYLVKGLILIPHLIILEVLAIAVSLAELVIWIPVLFTARYPPDWDIRTSSAATCAGQPVSRCTFYGLTLIPTRPSASTRRATCTFNVQNQAVVSSRSCLLAEL